MLQMKFLSDHLIASENPFLAHSSDVGLAGSALNSEKDAHYLQQVCRGAEVRQDLKLLLMFFCIILPR